MNIILYLKESPLGLKYLGKCVNRDVFTYLGSGKIWKLHLKKHGFTCNDIKTTILLETSDCEELKKVGTYYSDLWDIVNSNDFANLRPETGDGGWQHMVGVPKTVEWKDMMSKRIRTPEERKKLSDWQKGKTLSEEHRQKLSVARKSYRHSPETNRKRAISVSKAKKGKPLSDKHKLSLKKPKDPNKNYSTCEICGKRTTKTVISRNHGVNKCNKI